ncbi:MAG: hypothetical protein GX458_15260 [Phyllobacteriaceae bacterium]|nr:hypothetical protein [Phyllobacteriaceae bacterium]
MSSVDIETASFLPSIGPAMLPGAAFARGPSDRRSGDRTDLKFLRCGFPFLHGAGGRSRLREPTMTDRARLVISRP